MIHEKVFRYALGREAKVIVKGEKTRYRREVILEFEFLIKDTHDQDFRAPIGVNHPQYWKLKNYTPEKAQYLQLEYSGVSRRELLETVKEFRSLFGPGFIFTYQNPIKERIKNLKGIRVPATSRRVLSTLV